MKFVLIFSALAAASTLAGAQAKTTRPDSTCTKYSDGRIECRVYRVGPDSMFRRFTYRMDSVMANRAALGLEIRSTGSRRDTLGVFVEAVTPKGPAESAGIVEGDRIASINGVDLRTSAADADDDFARGAAPRRLTREVQKLTPGARVTLRVYSGGRIRDVQVTAAKASDVMRLGRGFGRGGGFEFYGPGRDFEYFGPDRLMIGPELPRMLRQDIEPMLRQRLRDLPERIQLRTVPRIRTLRVPPRTYRVDRGAEELRAEAEPTVISFDDDLDDVIIDGEDLHDLEYFTPAADDMEYLEQQLDDQLLDVDVEPVSSEAISDLAATTVRDARAALKQLSEAGIV